VNIGDRRQLALDDRLGLGRLPLVGGWFDEEVVEAACEVSLEGAQRAFAGFAFREAVVLVTRRRVASA
jgi:hypothetical protein